MAKRPYHRSNKVALKAPRQNEPLLLELCSFHEIDGRSGHELSESAGYGNKALHRIRAGTYDPSFRQVVDLGQVLGYELKWHKINQGE